MEVNIICGDSMVDDLVVEPVWLRIPAYLNGCSGSTSEFQTD